MQGMEGWGVWGRLSCFVSGERGCLEGLWAFVRGGLWEAGRGVLGGFCERPWLVASELD